MTSRSLAAAATAAMAFVAAPPLAHAAPPVHRHVAGGPPSRAVVLTAKGMIRSDTTSAPVTAI